jgi:hypothetical protein
VSVDRLGRDCPETRPVPGAERARYPVLDEPHREAMIRDLYAAGWSYWLIAQLAHMEPDAARAVLTGGSL